MPALGNAYRRCAGDIFWICLLTAALLAGPENPEVAVALLSLDDWQACAHLAGTTSGACDQIRVMQSGLCFFPRAALASCYKFPLGCDAILPWGWDNSLLGTVINFRRSGAPRERMLSPLVCTWD